VTNLAYQKILDKDFLITGYDVSFSVRRIILDLLDYLIANYNRMGVWDSRVVVTICRSWRPKTTHIEAQMITALVREALCEELVLPKKDYRIWYRVDGEFIYYIPMRIENHVDGSALHAGDL